MNILENTQRWSLWLRQHYMACTLQGVNVVLGVLGLWCSLRGILPLSAVNFWFFSFLVFLVALYRPIWIFLLLVGMLPYEIINLAPVELGVFLRPYQWLLVILIGALLVRSLTKRPVVQRIYFEWWDILPLLFLVGAGFAALRAEPSGPAFKLAFVLASFVALLFVAKVLVRSTRELVHVVPFLLTSFGVVAIWSVLQNVLFAMGTTSFEIMAGRPNGTFSEADWLGMYMLFIAAIALGWLYRQTVQEQKCSTLFLPLSILFMSTLVLVLSMTRSAWLGFAAMGGFFALATLVTFGKLGTPKRGLLLLGCTGTVVVLAIVIVPVFHVSRFNLFERAVSTGGVQKITIACTEARSLPERIQSLEELPALGCQHINLEERAAFERAGLVVTEIGRDDPNVSVRKSIYERTFAVLKTHLVQGIGWGTIGYRLGTDERGAALNASNIFLEFWLGSGLIGFLAFSILWFALGFQSGRLVFSGGQSELAFPMFFHTAWLGLTVFNLFNSGVLLGFFFFFLGLGGLLWMKKR